MKVLRRTQTLSSNARRLYEREMRRLRAFCRRNRTSSYSESTLLGFLAERAPNCTPDYFHCVVNTLRRWFADHGERCPLDHARALARIQRLALATKPFGAWQYYDAPAVRRLFDSMHNEPEDIRDAAMLALIYYARATCTEVANMQLGDVTILRIGMRIAIDGPRGPIVIPRTDDPRYSAVVLLERWLMVRGRAPGPLFYAMRHHHRICESVPLGPPAVVSRLRKRAAACGLPPTVKALHHSMLMIGFQRGATQTQLLQQGRYRSLTGLKRIPRDLPINLLRL